MGILFYSKKYYTGGFRQLSQKTALVKKQQFFWVYPVFWLFYWKDKKYKETQKSTHPKQCPVPVKKVSNRSKIGSLRNRGEKLGHFYRLWPQYLIQDSIWELWAQHNFWYTLQDLSATQVSKISDQPFSRNPGKGGDTLKIWYKNCIVWAYQ